VPVCQVDGADVRTVEGLGDVARLSPLQQAFLETGGAQCGICTPGMLMAAGAYLDAGGAAVDEDIREAIAGNLCRCTGYTKIIEAIALAAERRIASVYGTLSLPRSVDELIEEMRGPAVFPPDPMNAGDP
jgi:carbon-monoxide dehydrogenase small subunit